MPRRVIEPRSGGLISKGKGRNHSRIRISRMGWHKTCFHRWLGIRIRSHRQTIQPFILLLFPADGRTTRFCIRLFSARKKKNFIRPTRLSNTLVARLVGIGSRGLCKYCYWNYSDNGEFTVSSAYNSIMMDKWDQEHPKWDLAWKWQGPQGFELSST